MTIFDPTTQPNATAIKGSKFILQNTSYSGVDIKIAVNIYNKEGTSDRRITEIIDSLGKDQNEITVLNREISRLNKMLDNVHPSTQESFRYTVRLGELFRRRGILQKRIQERPVILHELEISKAKNTTKILAEAQTLSVSIFRDKQAVRALGSVYPKSFVRGPREIAGTMVFTVFDEHVLSKFLEAHPSDYDASHGLTSALMDQLPPVDITILFANEYGYISRMAILGVEFVDEGQTMSIEDIITENVVSFVARDIDPMRAIGNRKLDNTSNILQYDIARKASDLLLESDYQDIKNQLSPFDRFKNRRTPFL